MGTLLESLHVILLGQPGARVQSGGTVVEATPPEPGGRCEVQRRFAGVPGAQEMVHLLSAGDRAKVGLPASGV